MQTRHCLFFLLPALACFLTTQAQDQPPSPTPSDTAPAIAPATTAPAPSAPTTDFASSVVSPSPTAPSPSGVDPDKEEQIRKLLELTGTVKLIDQMKIQLLISFKKQRPDVPPELWSKLAGEIDTKAVIDRFIPVYDKYYTLDDLVVMNAFYESPVGQKMLANNPEIAHQSAVLGQDWSKQVGQKAEQEIAQAWNRARGAELIPTSATALAPASAPAPPPSPDTPPPSR